MNLHLSDRVRVIPSLIATDRTATLGAAQSTRKGVSFKIQREQV